MTEFKSFYKTVGGNEGGKCNYPTRLDTYGKGCSHDCKYCYAKSLLEFRDLWNADDPAVADIKKIRKKVAQLKGTTTPIRLGGMTDCFQPIEKKYRVTYETIRALNENRVPYLIVTKSPMVAEDEYLEILDKNLAHIQITVTTTDDDLSKTYERAAVPSARIKAIEKLYEMGFDVDIREFSKFAEYQNKQIKDALLFNHYSADDFAEWVINGNVDKAQNVRQIPQILKEPEAKKEFFKTNLTNAIKKLNTSVSTTVDLSNLGYEEVGNAFLNKIRNISYAETKCLKKRETKEYEDKMTLLIDIYNELDAMLDDLNAE